VSLKEKAKLSPQQLH